MTLSDRLDALGWNGVPPITVFVNIIWLYLAAQLDADVPLRLIDGRNMRNENHARACCERALAAMLDEAERVGKIDLLCCPGIREPFEVMATLERMYGE